jgi:uncharacterized protein YebE (UPF0316 family)
MKTRRNIYYSIGASLIILNLLVDFVNLSDFLTEIETGGFSIGYIIGYHISMIFGIILLRLGYGLSKKIKLAEGFDVDTSIENSGKP